MNNLQSLENKGVKQNQLVTTDERLEKSEILKIDLSPLFGGFVVPPIEFDGSEIEPLTQYSFTELKNERFESGNFYFLALIKQSNEQGCYYYNFDAISLAGWLKGKNPPKNPFTNHPFKKIFYFFIRPKEDTFRRYHNVNVVKPSFEGKFIQLWFEAQANDKNSQFTATEMTKGHVEAQLVTTNDRLEKSEILKIDLSSLFGRFAIRLGEFNGSENEMFTNRSFTELKNKQFESGKSYFLALIKQSNEQGCHYYKFDAISLAGWLKGKNPPKNPRTDHPFKKIFYFFIDSNEGIFRRYHTVNVVKPSDKEKFIQTWFEAQAGDENSQFTIAEMYTQGVGIEASPQESSRFLKMAANQGHAEAQFILSARYKSGYGIEKDSQQAFKYAKLAADQGHVKAQHILNLYYESGYGIEKDLQQAFKYAKLAADQGLGQAQYEVARHFENGHGIEVNPQEAFRYMKLAADQFLIAALYPAGLYYKEGFGVEVSLQAALYYIKLAAERNIKEAQYDLGIILANRPVNLYNILLDLKINDRFQFLCMQVAADQGSQQAQYEVSLCYKYSTGVTKSPEEAFRYMKMAVDHKEEGSRPSAFYHLAKYYEEGIGIETSADQAAHYMKMAQDEGSIEAIYEMGIYTSQGFGVKQDPKEALRLLTKAINSGYKDLDSLAKQIQTCINNKDHDLLKASITSMIEKNQWNEVLKVKDNQTNLNLLWYVIMKAKNFEASKIILSSTPIEILYEVAQGEHEIEDRPYMFNLAHLFWDTFNKEHSEEREFKSLLWRLSHAVYASPFKSEKTY